jgi:hypothetical protein
LGTGLGAGLPSGKLLGALFKDSSFQKKSDELM